MSWEEVRLEDITSIIGDGLHGTPAYDENGEYYFINGNNLEDGKIILKNETKRISEQEYNKIKKNLSNRTIFIGINGTLGNLAIYNNEKVALGKSACYLNIKNDVNKLFVYYILKNYDFQDYAGLFATGATIKNLSLKAIRNYKFKLPSLNIQQKIVNLISNYDNLIENNNKRIKLLENMAEELYKEWFVRLRFPNYQNTKIVDGIPDEWKNLKIDNICTVGRGSSPRPISDIRYFKEGTIPWLKIADATASFIYVYKTKEYVNEYGASFSRKLKENSIIIAASGTLGFPMFLATECCIHDGWMYFDNIEDEIKIYFYYSLIYLKDYFNNQSYGAAIQNINTDIVKNSSILFPSKKIINNFNQIVKPMFDEIKILQLKNQNLKETRDLLLPRLISGKLDIKDLHIV